MKALAIFAVIPFALLSAHENNGRGTKAIALANAFVACSDNAWAISYNPAGLAKLTSPQISAFFVPQQFGVPELRTVSMSGAYNTNVGTIAALVEQFGFDLYRTTEIGLGYGLSLDTMISVGATVNGERIAIGRYGAAQSFTLDIGFLGSPFANIDIGFCWKNVSASTIGINRERLPQYLLFGICYTPFDDFCLVSELEKDLRFPAVFKAGVEQRFFGFLSLRCGVANNPDKFSAGLAVQYSTFEFGYAGYSHPDLGWTHQIEISMRWGN